MSNDGQEVIHTSIWLEQAGDNPFQAERCYCAGFDVFGELIEKASLVEYLFLLFRLDPPSEVQRRLFNKLAIALANPGPRDLSVRAAMSAGVGRSTVASSLIAALAVGAGKYTGAREVFVCANLWQRLQTDLNAWRQALHHREFEPQQPEVWPEMEHPPGFDPYAETTSTPCLQLLQSLCEEYSEGALGFLHRHREELEVAAGCPLSMTGIATAALMDLGFNNIESETLFLLLRLPGAAAHSLEQRGYGWRQYPFFGKSLVLKDYNRTESSNES